MATFAYASRSQCGKRSPYHAEADAFLFEADLGADPVVSQVVVQVALGRSQPIEIAADWRVLMDPQRLVVHQRGAVHQQRLGVRDDRAELVEYPEAVRVDATSRWPVRCPASHAAQSGGSVSNVALPVAIPAA